MQWGISTGVIIEEGFELASVRVILNEQFVERLGLLWRVCNDVLASASPCIVRLPSALYFVQP
jgi:hypothetical protein